MGTEIEEGTRTSGMMMVSRKRSGGEDVDLAGVSLSWASAANLDREELEGVSPS